jgi:hypothetical protein
MTHHGPDSGEATTFPFIVFSAALHRGYIQVALFPRTPKVESRTVPKLSRFRLPGLWATITSRPKLGSGQGLNKSCSSRRELSNDVLHFRCRRREEVDSRLLVVGSQIVSLTPGPSFAHNLSCRCPNGQCEAVWTSTFQDLSNDTKNTPMRGVLALQLELYIFGSPRGLQVPTFGSVGFTLTLSPKWGCDTGVLLSSQHFGSKGMC